MTNRLSQILQRLDHEFVPGPSDRLPSLPDCLTFAGGRYRIRVANDLESREQAYRLVYRLYLEKEYVRPHVSRMWVGPFDALPETVTLLVERTAVEGGRWKMEGQDGKVEDGGLKVEGNNANNFPQPSTLHLPPSTASVPVGALTVVFDSAAGLPADELYKAELDALRASGRRLSEIVSLGVDADAAGGSEVLVKLFNLVYLASRRVRAATDFVITVNPRHVRFYEKTLLFAPAGPERNYRKVGGAPAVLLRLDLAVPEERVRLEHGPAQARPPKSRTLYPMFVAPEDEAGVVEALAASLRPMSDGEARYFGIEPPGDRKRAAAGGAERARTAEPAEKVQPCAYGDLGGARP